MSEPKSEHRSKQPPSYQNNGRCGKGAELKSTLIPLELSKFPLPVKNVPIEHKKNNGGTGQKFTLSVANVPVEYQQNDDETDLKFTLMSFDKRTNPGEFALLKQYLQDARCEEPESFVNLKHAKVFKVNCDGFDSDDFKFGNCLMLHGTSFECSRKILSKGYKNSAFGYFGRGVYMTESIDMAVHYSVRKTLKYFTESLRGNNLKKTYVFVNQVSKPRNLMIEKYESYDKLKIKYEAPKHPFCKNVHQDSPDRKMKIDSEGRYHNKVPGLSLLDEYVADYSLVKPKFFIEIEPSGFDFEKYLKFKKYLFEKIN